MYKRQIFNGSSSRKPVSTATIELLFDNTDKKVGGEYSKYNEISTKRVVTRDGQSRYFLNGVKCRRKDITSLFLGTGLGPRSYAIVQQDTISKLIEAKPDDMRVFLEEASGVSKYKQKSKETDSRMQKSIESLNREMSIIRTGRANPSLVEDILVDYYGVPTPLNQLSSISIPEARVLMIQPWDKQSLKDIEKGIQLANIGLTPNNDGTVVRLSLPILTEERRRELVRMVKRKVEDGHVSIRNIRRDSITILRNMEKNSEISQDESRRSQDLSLIHI